jgi:cytochrome bd-type quinol oxidase subunit 2
MTSGGRKQFAALYPNSDEPGHRLNSRPTSAIYRTDSLALISTAETIPFVSQNSRPSPRRALSSFFTTFNFRLPASSRMVASLGASVWPHAIPCVLNIWDAASEHRTQVIPFFAFTGFVPVILAHVGFSYWTFGGKVGAP